MHRILIAVLGCAWVLRAADPYVLGPDSQRHPGVPAGAVSRYSWSSSKIFPGTTRNYWVYVPAQYDGTKPACVMVFQDGAGFQNPDGGWRAPVVFDNLIHQGAMPVTIGIFVDPGVLPASSPAQQNRYNRSYEYDGLGPRYARFLLEEILPEVGKKYKLSNDPNDRAIAGSSSGGIAAFTVAWERPDAFRRVLSFIGSYTDLRGGDVYANLIRKVEPKPIRVFLQDGSNDLNIYGGSWYLANQSMAKSLAYAGYDVRFEVGTEGHNGKHGGAILPEALRWLWRDYLKPIEASTGGVGERHFITEFLDPGQDWQLAGQGYQSVEGLATDREGNVYFCDVGAAKMYKAAGIGKAVLFQEHAGPATGLMFGGNGWLYAAEPSRRRVVAYTRDGRMQVLASGVEAQDLAVTSNGGVYFTSPNQGKVYYIDPKGRRRLVFDGREQGNLLSPAGVRLFPDESLLVVTDTLGRAAWSFHIQADGSLEDGEPFYFLEIPDQIYEGDHGPLRSGAKGMVFDNTGHLFVATKLGIQICDQLGRVVGIIRAPAPGVSNVAFGGPDLSTLYVAAGDKVYRRHLRRAGYHPWQPLKPPRPQL
jgi:gluconolactonase